jgi:hypothetical protein
VGCSICFSRRLNARNRSIASRVKKIIPMPIPIPALAPVLNSIPECVLVEVLRLMVVVMGVPETVVVMASSEPVVEGVEGFDSAPVGKFDGFEG